MEFGEEVRQSARKCVTGLVDNILSEGRPERYRVRVSDRSLTVRRESRESLFDPVQKVFGRDKVVPVDHIFKAVVLGDVKVRADREELSNAHARRLEIVILDVLVEHIR